MKLWLAYMVRVCFDSLFIGSNQNVKNVNTMFKPKPKKNTEIQNSYFVARMKR